MSIIASIIDNLNNEVQEEFSEKKKLGLIQEDNNSPMGVVIKPNQFNVHGLKEYKGEEIKKFEFRPQIWEQFIGQKEAKERAKTIIKKIDKGLKSHFLVDGIKGHGKTTYVELLARDIDAEIIKVIGKQVNIDNLVDYLNKIHDSKKENVIFFVDEIDTMSKEVIKTLNPIIESFEISGKKLRPFIFAGATINKHILLKNNPDTLDRIPIHIKFKRYNASEIQQILNQYIGQLYSEEGISEEAVATISENCKYNPRTAIGLLEEQIVEKNIQKVLKNCHIVKDGLTNIDVKILKILNTSTRAVGANALSMKAGLSQEEYLREFEPYLIEAGYINRVPSRVITEKGKEILKCL